jgi:8-oxo-dGTP pyrophosphatase MutT (NUDIX family)
MVEPWPLLRSQPGPSYHVFSIRTDTARSPRTGREHDFYVLESADWVSVIPLTPDGQVVMVRQYRHGIREVTLEVPGGLVEPDHTPLETARRELLEETGYEAEEITFIGAAHPQPAVLNNRHLTFLATGVRKTAAPDPDEGEDIEVVLFPLSELQRKIGEGEITNAMVILAFYWYFL